MLTDCVNVIIDGFPDYLHKLSLAERPAIPSPKRQIDTTQVKGRLGSLVRRYSYEDIEFSLNFNYLEEVEEYQSFKEKFYIIRNWLNQAKELQFSDEPNIKYIIQNIDIEDAENDIIEWGSFTAKVTCKPFGRLVEDVPIIVNQPKTVELLNNAFTDSYPLLILTPSQVNCTIVVNDKRFIFQGITVGQDIYIDSELMLVYTKQADGDILDLSNKMVSLEYPVLTPEVNTLVCTNISKLQVFRNAMR